MYCTPAHLHLVHGNDLGAEGIRSKEGHGPLDAIVADHGYFVVHANIVAGQHVAKLIHLVGIGRDKQSRVMTRDKCCLSHLSAKVAISHPIKYSRIYFAASAKQISVGKLLAGSSLHFHQTLVLILAVIAATKKSSRTIGNIGPSSGKRRASKHGARGRAEHTITTKHFTKMIFCFETICCGIEAQQITIFARLSKMTPEFQPNKTFLFFEIHNQIKLFNPRVIIRVLYIVPLAYLLTGHTERTKAGEEVLTYILRYRNVSNADYGN